jgi:hypothetical protein
MDLLQAAACMVSQMVVGSITQFGNKHKARRSEEWGARAGGFGLGGVGSRESAAIVNNTVRGQ